MQHYEQELVEIISQDSGLAPDLLRASTGLLSTGVLDSFAFVTVITFVEELIGNEVPPADLTFANFDTIAGMCAYVERARTA